MTRPRTAGILVVLLATVSASWAESPAPPPAPGTAPAPEAPPTVTLPAPLARVLTDYETAWRNKHAAALAALFTEDGFVLSNGSPAARGREEIEKRYRGHGGPLFLRAFSFAIDGSIAWILGGYAGRPGGPDDGKFTLTLRKGPDGRWLIHSDMDNANARR